MTVEGVYPAMSLALAHFAFGATVTTLLVALLPGVRYPRTVVLAGGGTGGHLGSTPQPWAVSVS